MNIYWFTIKIILFFLLLSIQNLFGFANEQFNRTANSFNVKYDYIPEHTIDGLTIRIHPRRFVEVTWKGQNLLTQGCELFTRNYNSRDPNHFPGNPIGYYMIEERKPAFDIPIWVEIGKNSVIYQWVCDDFEAGYRQINKAVLRSNRVVIQTTLEIQNQFPDEIVFNPVFFPGKSRGYKGGEPNKTIDGKNFTIVDANDKHKTLVYPKKPIKHAWNSENWRSITTNTTGGKVRFTLRSDLVDFKTSLYAQAYWPWIYRPGNRRALIANLIFHPKMRDNFRPIMLTYQLQIDVEDYPDSLNESIEALNTLDSDNIKITPILNDRRFWFFYPDESIDLCINIADRWSDCDRSVRIVCEIRNYNDQLMKKIFNQLTVPSSGVVEHIFQLGKLERGIYSVSLWAYEEDTLVGHTGLRIGIVPRYKIIDKRRSLGTYQCYNSNIYEKTELMQWIGIGKARFRAGNHKEFWSRFEPQTKHYEHLMGVKNALVHRKRGIDLVYYGGFFPPRKPLPSWIKKDNVYFFHGRSNKVLDCWLPMDLSIYKDFIKSWSKNFDGLINYFEIFNEMNDTMEIEDAAKIVKLTSKAIKSQIPCAKIAIADINRLDLDQIKWLDQLLEQTHEEIDVITYHHYKKGWYKRSRNSNFPIIEEFEWENDLDMIKVIAKKYNKPLWNGEISWAGSPIELFPNRYFRHQERNTTNTITRSYLLTKHAGIESIISCFATELRNPNSNYILFPERASCSVGWQWMIKPWAVAHATMAKLLDTAVPLERIDLGHDKVYALCFERADKTLFVALWCTGGRVMLINSFQEADVRLMSVVGQPIPLTNFITLTPSPIYLISKQISKKTFLAQIREAKLEFNTAFSHSEPF